MSRHCSTPLGSRLLRHWFRCPSASIEEIRGRLKAVSFLLAPCNAALVMDLRKAIKGVKNLPNLLKRLSFSKVGLPDWKAIYRSIEAVVTIGRLVSPHGEAVGILSDLAELVGDEVVALHERLKKTIDFNAWTHRKSFSVQAGICSFLDETKGVLKTLTNVMSEYVDAERKNLEGMVNTVSFSYIPQVSLQLYCCCFPSTQRHFISR